jgi:hypothetical protein
MITDDQISEEMSGGQRDEDLLFAIDYFTTCR